MTITANAIITDAYERCNRLSPGETLNADDAAFGFRRLNILVDEMSAQNVFLFKSVLTSAAQTGAITLGTGSWAAISPGDEIVSATSNGVTLLSVTMMQYNQLYETTTTGAPSIYAQDGLSTVYLYPVANGQTIKLQTLTGVTSFADQTTTYTVPDGVTSALGAALAVRIAPSVLGSIPPYLLKAEQKAMGVISKYAPQILDVTSYSRGLPAARILTG